MAWRHLGDKPLSEPMVIRVIINRICVNIIRKRQSGRHLAEEISKFHLLYENGLFCLKVIEICSQGFDKQDPIAGSHNALALNMWRAIIGT